MSALDIHREFQIAHAAEGKSREALKLIPKDSPNREFALKTWNDNFSWAEKTRTRAESAMGAAAHNVQRSYGIQTPKSGKVANGPFAGAEVSWSLGVQVDRENAIRQAVTPDGEVRHLKFPKDSDPEERVAGITQDDGKALLGVAAFESAVKHGVGTLAMSIYHESVHYAQLTTSGWETRAKTEAEAYAAEMAALKDIYVPSKTWRNKFFRAMTWNAIRAGEILLPARTPAPFTPDSEDNRNRAEFEGTLADIRAEQSSLAIEVEQRAQNRRERLRQAQETQERLAREQAGRERIAEEERRRRRVSDTIRSLADAFCDSPVLADMRGLVIHSQWATVVREIEIPPTVLDIDEMGFEGTCTQYLINQALYGKRIGRDSASEEWLNFAVREGILRANGGAPLYERLRAASPPPPPSQSTPPPGGTWGSTPEVEDPPSNPIPHCRYHDWCKEPKRRR